MTQDEDDPGADMRLGLNTPRFTRIRATSFGGAHDHNTSAYSGSLIDGTKPGVALPYHFPGARPTVRVFRSGRTVDCPIIDVGPWYPSKIGVADQYWARLPPANRPRAEDDRRTNHAGVDLTPGAWQALGYLGDPEDAEDYVDWDFVDRLDDRPPSLVGVNVGSIAATVAPKAPLLLLKQIWPLQRDCDAYYGNPRVAGFVSNHLTDVPVPWKMVYETSAVTHILINRRCADSLARVLGYIWHSLSCDQGKIADLRYDRFSGSYNYRPMRGAAALSMHAYGAAIDWDDADNPQHSQHHLFTDDSLLVKAFKAEGWIWGGDWSPGSIDAMHVQAARVHGA